MDPVWSTILLDHEERFGPPCTVLKVGLSDDVVFLQICDYQEDYDTSTTKAVAQIGVNVEALLYALGFVSAV